MKYTRIIGFISICALAIMVSQVHAAPSKVYTWKDAKGVVHYGERPPANSQARLVKTSNRRNTETPAPVTPATATTAAATATTAAPSLKDAVRCETAKKNLELLNTVALVKITGSDGIARTLTEEEKVTQRTTMQEVMKQSCE